MAIYNRNCEACGADFELNPEQMTVVLDINRPDENVFISYRHGASGCGAYTLKLLTVHNMDNLEQIDQIEQDFLLNNSKLVLFNAQLREDDGLAKTGTLTEKDSDNFVFELRARNSIHVLEKALTD